MIVEGLFYAILKILSALLAVINLPGMPEGVRDLLTTFTGYLATGIALVANYVDIDYLLLLFGVVMAVDGGVLIYKLIMWIIRKIPVSSE